jgi:hypothetical protein
MTTPLDRYAAQAHGPERGGKGRRRHQKVKPAAAITAEGGAALGSSAEAGAVQVVPAELAVPDAGPAATPAGTEEASPAETTPANDGMSRAGRLRDLLAAALADEPPLDGAISRVYRQADKRLRRRSRAAAAAGIGTAALVIALGYGLTTALLPTAPRHVVTMEAAPQPDPARTVLANTLRASRFTVVPREPGQGNGWRQYLVLNSAGRPHGLVEISAYDAREGLCFPLLTFHNACARPLPTAAGGQYVRYTFDDDVDWQVNEVIARRLADGRTIVVQATGERGTGTAAGGRPPLSALLAAKIATDPRTATAFGPDESCNGPDPACPILKVPVAVGG